MVLVGIGRQPAAEVAQLQELPAVQVAGHHSRDEPPMAQTDRALELRARAGQSHSASARVARIIVAPNEPALLEPRDQPGHPGLGSRTFSPSSVIRSPFGAVDRA